MSDSSMLLPVYGVKIVRDAGRIMAFATPGLLNRARPKDQWLSHGTIVNHEEIKQASMLRCWLVADDIPQFKNPEARPSGWDVFATCYQNNGAFKLSELHVSSNLGLVSAGFIDTTVLAEQYQEDLNADNYIQVPLQAADPSVLQGVETVEMYGDLDDNIDFDPFAD